MQTIVLCRVSFYNTTIYDIYLFFRCKRESRTKRTSKHESEQKTIQNRSKEYEEKIKTEEGAQEEQEEEQKTSPIC